MSPDMAPLLPVLQPGAAVSNAPPRSTGAYSPDKALAWPDRLVALRAGGQPYPVHVHLILSDLCNLSCPGCAYRMEDYSSAKLFATVDEHGFRNANPNRMLDGALVERMLRQFAEIGVRGVECTGGGEPTLHPDFARLYALGLDLGLDMALITNGLLLARRPELFALVARSTWFRVSIDAATEQTYGVVRPSLGAPHGENIHRALAAIRGVRDARDAAKAACSVGAGFVVQRENWQEIHDAVRIYREAGADNVRISGLFSVERDRYFDGWRERAEELEARAVADFDGKDGFRVHGRLREKVADLVSAPDYKVCDYQQLTTYVGGDGSVYRCCVTAYNPTGLVAKLDDFGGDFKALWDSQVKHARFANFDASRSCTHCQFNDRNRAIRAAVEAPELPPAPEGVVHPSFV